MDESIHNNVDELKKNVDKKYKQRRKKKIRDSTIFSPAFLALRGYE